MKYDVVIIGAGPAGLTAALYAVRSGLKTAVVSKDIGGTTNSILILENWPGFKGSGAELIKQIYEQVQKYDVKFILEEVKQIKKESGFLIKTDKQEIKSKSVILTSGTSRRKLKILGEEELTGKGVSYCVTCDGFFFKGKTVAVIGGSDCAATAALALTDIAKKVYVIYRGVKLRCENINSERLEKSENVELIYNAIPLEIKGKDKVERLKILENKSKKEIDIDGIFIEVGATPLTEFTKDLGLKLDKEGYVIVDENMRTSVEGVFAAGDLANHKLKQVIVASGQGAIAGKEVYDWLNNNP